MQPAMREQIQPGAFLTCVTTEKFKTGCLSMNIVTPINRENASKNALLPKVLRRGTSSLPDIESLSAALDELYGARIEPIIRKKGENHCVGLFSDFIDDDYVPRGENILERAAALMGGMLLSPNTRGGLLTGEYVESEKNNLIDEIRAAINDKRAYAVDRLIENMCRGENFGANKLGTESAAAAITSSSLTNHYRKLISESMIEIFYCGAAAHARVKSAVLEALAALPRKNTDAAPDTFVKLAPSGKPKLVTEELSVSQAKLAMGFRVGDAMKNPNYAALMVFNALYGGSVTSKLFRNVRERLSLCYYASSTLEKHKGIMTVSSGIEFDRFDEAREEITAQLRAIARGDISDWELTSAKRAVITSIKSTMDRPSGLEELYFDQSIARAGLEPDELAALADGVTADEITAIASGVGLDTVYLLSGNGENADEDPEL